MLENGKYGIIKSITFQQLETPEATYNFEVEDYHTYYVGEKGTLVHNADCSLNQGTKEWNRAVKDIRNSANNKGKLNYIVNSQTTAESLAGEAGLPLQSLEDVIYVHNELQYAIGYKIHPIDNAVGMSHLKFWSGRTNGHIYWPRR